MDFLLDWAEILAGRGEPLQWTTPTGLPWANRYHKYKTKRVRSLLGGICVRQKIADGYEPAIRVKKSMDAASANFIHAVDASHLVWTVNACSRADMTNILAVHDSFSCLAPRAEQLNGIIREQLEAMHDQCDPLTEIRERALARIKNQTPSRMAEALEQHPLAPKGKRVADAVGIEVPNFPEVPKRGKFDLRELIKNVYIFS